MGPGVDSTENAFQPSDLYRNRFWVEEDDINYTSLLFFVFIIFQYSMSIIAWQQLLASTLRHTQDTEQYD